MIYNRYSDFWCMRQVVQAKQFWILGNLFQSIRNNLIKGSDVIYFNEDDGAKGVLQKAKLGHKHGMTMVTLATSPDPYLRNTSDALRLLSAIRQEGEADGKIVICDTLKKFAPVLNKADMREVLHVFREFSRGRWHSNITWALQQT